jgi:N-methylhydantoinase A
LIEDFHGTHQEIFAINDPDSIVEMVGWISSVNCRLRKNIGSRLQEIEAKTVIGSRKIYFDGAEVTTPIYPLQSVPMALATEGPAIIETPYTTIVIDPAARFYRSEHGSVMILP